MRNFRSTILPFDFIELPKRIINNDIRQPLLQFRQAQRFNQAKMCFGFKDNSMNYLQQQRQDFFNTVFNFIPIIDPQSPWLIVWNLVTSAALLYNFFMAVLVISFTQLAFYTDITTIAGYTINILSLVVLYVDIIVRFHVGFYRRQRLIQNRKDVFMNYFKYQFFLDFAANLCLTVYITSLQYAYAFVRLGVYLRFLGLARIDESVIQNLKNRAYLLFSYKIIRMVMISWLFTTWGACIFFILDYIYYVNPSGQYYQNGLLWLRNTGDFQNIDIIETFQEWYVWYEYALYWSIQTSVTTGYGDLTAKNPAQIVFSNIFMILMTVLFAYFVNYVLQSMLQLQDNTNSDETWIDLIKYLKTLELTQSQRDIISASMKKIYQDKAEESFRSFFLENISTQLRHEYEQATKSIFFRQNTFKHYFSDYNHLLLHYVYALSEKRFNQQERIYHQKQLDPHLYYIQKGTVILGVSDKKLSIKSLTQGQLFGEQQFYHQLHRIHYAKAFSFVKLWILNFHKFKQIAFNYSTILKNTKESFYELMQNFKIYQFMFLLQSKKCWICDKQYHNILECNERFYIHQGKNPMQQNSKRYDQHSFSRITIEKNRRANFVRPNHDSKKQIRKHATQRQKISIEVLYNFQKYRNSFNAITLS